MFKNNKKTYIMFIFFCISLLLVPFAFSKYNSTFNNQISLNINMPTYSVVFHSNTSPDTTTTQSFVYGTSQNLDSNTFTNPGLNFGGWNTQSNGSGTSYSDNELVNNLSQINNDTIDLYAQWVGGVAEINGTYYNTIHEAVAAVPTDDTETTIRVLANISLTSSDRITISQHQNIVFDLQSYTISNASGASLPLIENSGTVTIMNGILTSSAGEAVINNDSYGTVKVTGGQINATGSKQGIYNNGGILEISGNAIITNTSSSRAAVHNLGGGTLTVTGGTIIANAYYGIRNESTMTIGSKDGVVNKISPLIQGTYGIYSEKNFNMYDGIIKGKTQSFNDISKINDIEVGCDFVTGTERINSVNYKTTWLSDTVINITFDPNGGTVGETLRKIEQNNAIGTLPTPTYTDHIFSGWYTDPTEGSEVSSNTVFDHNQILYAHWNDAKAQANGKSYSSLQAAISGISDNTETTVTILTDLTENIQIPARKRVILDLQGNTLRNNGVSPVITNYGRLKIISGTITSNTSQGVINNKSGGILEVSGGSIIATGTRQAIYNDGGTVTISGTAYLSATSIERPTVNNLASSTMIITGGTIFSENKQAVDNLGTLTIGAKDGTIDLTIPTLIGATDGVTNSNIFNFYDGKIYGKTAAITGSVTDIETNSSIVSTTDTIGSETYNLNYLQLNP